MSEFINTIDVLGDDAVIDGIINRTITEFKDDAITEIGQNAFYNCTALTDVDLPNVATIGASAFQGCSSLKSVELPLVTKLPVGVFSGCTSLVNVNIPLLNSHTGGSVFYGCTSLKVARFPLLSGCWAGNDFRECSSLEFVDSALGRIRTNMFNGCVALKTLIIRANNICNLDTVSAFKSTPIENGTGYIYVPRALLSDDDETKDYRRATNWATFGNQFRALEDYTVDGTTTGELDMTKI